MGYGIYIIHENKKVGLAKDLNDRLAQQGYTKEEVEIFAEDIPDLSVARMIEKEVQKKLGYTEHENGPDLVDKFLTRKGLKTKNNNKTFYTKAIKDVTVGFPANKNDFDAWVDAKEKITIESPQYGLLVFDTPESKKWLKSNAKPSKFSSPDRATYIYLKAAAKFFETQNTIHDGKPGNLDDLIVCIHDWANNRGILDGNITTQTLKLGEEFGELQKAVLKDRPEEIKDAIGDIIVVLVSIAHFNGHSVADAVRMAYDTISKRTGYTNEKGDFIKQFEDGKPIAGTL